MLNTTELAKACETNDVVLLDIDKEQFSKVLVDASLFMASKFNKVCYLSLAKPFQTIEALLKKNKIDLSKFFFIDLLTATVSDPKEIDNCICLESPHDLTSLGIAVTESLKLGCDIVFIDSPFTLRIYNEETNVIKLIDSIITKVRVSSKKLLIVTIRDEKNKLSLNLHKVSDKVVEV